ncbi:MAG: twin-arginine translocase TatA/TatE family subunit [Elusimicrobia bacterium]|nr:twin-arginine translocase TatA/TatE family subunit [Elusimicrobiota bacterium]
MFNPGWGEWLAVAAIALLVFGAKRLPEIGQSLGKSIKAFKQGLKEDAPPEKRPEDIDKNKG